MKKSSIFPQLKAFDLDYQEKCGTICGVDEAGRGPLAGPVVAACVILHPDADLEELNDSKKLSEKKRELLFDMILNSSITYGIGMADADEIDQLNILGATFLAMERAANQAGVQKNWTAFIDGNRLPKQFPCKTICVVKGDSKSANIAAASILAKVTRDRIMKEYANQYPEYGFERHKGYPTKAHYEAIKSCGILPIHRKSFLKNLGDK